MNETCIEKTGTHADKHTYTKILTHVHKKVQTPPPPTHTQTHTHRGTGKSRRRRVGYLAGRSDVMTKSIAKTTHKAAVMATLLLFCDFCCCIL